MKACISFLFLVIFISCSNDDSSDTQVEADIVQYIDDHNLEAQRSSSGLYYVIGKQGSGTKPSSNSTVTVAYKGYFIDGDIFDQSDVEGITFNLQQVITGWTEGITYFNEGGEGILLIPPHLGYGSDNRNGIPGGSVLIFDIKLLNIN